MKIQVTAKVSEVQLHQVMQIWLAGNLQAHDFVAPDYWKQNYAEVAKQIKKLPSFWRQKITRFWDF